MGSIRKNQFPSIFLLETYNCNRQADTSGRLITREWPMDDITSFLEQVGSTALQIAVGMLVIIVLISIMDRRPPDRKDETDDRKSPPEGP